MMSIGQEALGDRREPGTGQTIPWLTQAPQEAGGALVGRPAKQKNGDERKFPPSPEIFARNI